LTSAGKKRKNTSNQRQEDKMKFKVDDRWLQEFRDERIALKVGGASRKELKEFAVKKAKEIGKSVQTLYAKADFGERNVSVKKEVTDKWNLIDNYARLTFNLAKSKSNDDAEIDYNVAFDTLQAMGDIPLWVKIHDVYKSIRERQNLETLSTPILKKTKRDSAVSLVHIDYSRSRYFNYDARDNSIVHVDAGEGYYKEQKDGENKRLRLWFCAAIDQYSQVCFAQYVLSKGESPQMTQMFMLQTFSFKEKLVGNFGDSITEQLLQGMPENIYWDRGPGHKTLTQKGLKNLNIGYINGSNKKDGFGKTTTRSNKGAHGMVENLNQEIKRKFEAGIHLMQKKGWKISIDELNERLREWCRLKNLARHPVFKDKKRWDLFEPALATLRPVPPKFMSYFAGEFERIVDNNRQIHCDNNIFIAPDEARIGDTIVVLFDTGAYYAMVNGRRHLLESNDEWHRSHKNSRTERDNDMLDGRELRIRLDEEVDTLSFGELTIAKLKPSHGDDMLCFYERSRSIAEIREFAALLVREGGVLRPSNVISFKPAKN
jgi:hypothetical protein